MDFGLELGGKTQEEKLFKIGNKTYHLKTNKKGVAKVTIKKSVLNKLEVGQKDKNDTATRSVTVKKQG